MIAPRMRVKMIIRPKPAPKPKNTIKPGPKTYK